MIGCYPIKTGHFIITLSEKPERDCGGPRFAKVDHRGERLN